MQFAISPSHTWSSSHSILTPGHLVQFSFPSSHNILTHWPLITTHWHRVLPSHTWLSSHFAVSSSHSILTLASSHSTLTYWPLVTAHDTLSRRVTPGYSVEFAVSSSHSILLHLSSSPSCCLILSQYTDALAIQSNMLSHLVTVYWHTGHPVQHAVSSYHSILTHWPSSPTCCLILSQYTDTLAIQSNMLSHLITVYWHTGRPVKLAVSSYHSILTHWPSSPTCCLILSQYTDTLAIQSNLLSHLVTPDHPVQFAVSSSHSILTPVIPV